MGIADVRKQIPISDGTINVLIMLGQLCQYLALPTTLAKLAII